MASITSSVGSLNETRLMAHCRRHVHRGIGERPNPSWCHWPYRRPPRTLTSLRGLVVASRQGACDLFAPEPYSQLAPAPLIAGNQRGQVYLLRFREVARRFHEEAVLVVTAGRIRPAVIVHGG